MSQPSDLALCTTQELIDELLRRQTFYGCIVQSTTEHKNDDWSQRVFRVHHNHHLDRTDVARLLETIGGRLSLNLG